MEGFGMYDAGALGEEEGFDEAGRVAQPFHAFEEERAVVDAAQTGGLHVHGESRDAMGLGNGAGGEAEAGGDEEVEVVSGGCEGGFVGCPTVHDAIDDEAGAFVGFPQAWVAGEALEVLLGPYWVP